MSFRARLTVFLLLIVALPMVVVAVLTAQTVDDASTGKSDARLFAGLEVASNLYEEETAAARDAAQELATNPAFGAVLRSGEPEQVEAVAVRLADSHGIEALVVRSEDGRELAQLGGEPFAATQQELTDGGSQVGTLAASVTTRERYLERVEELTGREGAVYVEGQGSVTVGKGSERIEVPDDKGETVTVDGRERRVLTGDLPDREGSRIALFGPVEEGGVFESSPLVPAAVIAVFLIALVFVLSLMRTLSGQVASMLEAAKRIGAGDFSHKVPVVGGERDEMAGLATEFNKMSERLAEQMDRLKEQQVEIDRSVRRIGEAFASGLDRSGLLEIVAETAVSACRAHFGLIALTGREGAEVSTGKANDAIQDLVLSAEAQATRGDELVELEGNGAHVLSAPLMRIADPGHNLGVMTIARMGAPFKTSEKDVFIYLIGQASASIENVALHEMVSEQAVTDELTGLANNRAFHDFADKEAARAERFAHPLSLVMLDIDDFKKVNDTYGHLQGDEVLRRIGAILRAESRGIDEPARYGGEEFVIALPETTVEGAAELAERVRERIEAERVPFISREGILRISASLGVATIPDSAGDVQALIAAADSALYAAKRGGKNRVEVAPERGKGKSKRRPAASADTAA